MKGILSHSDMIRAIAEDRKTVTRRQSGLKGINQNPDNVEYKGVVNEFCTQRSDGGPPPGDGEIRLFYVYTTGVYTVHYPLSNCPVERFIKPLYRVGDIVYIKEAHYAYGEWQKEQSEWIFHRDFGRAVTITNDIWKHALTGHTGRGWFKRSPLFMFEKDARYHIKIVDVEPERLRLPLSPRELALEGGSAALKYLEGYEGKWLWRIQFERVGGP